MRSIAFPALGTRNLNYPSNSVASSMFLVADEFVSANNVGSLAEINFVIYSADTDVLQVCSIVGYNFFYIITWFPNDNFYYDIFLPFLIH